MPGNVVTYSSSDDTDAIKALEIQGTLDFATDTPTELLVGTIEVLPSGTLQIGTTDSPESSTAMIKFAGGMPDMTNDPKQYETGLIAYGTVSFHGSPIGTLGATTSQTWLNLDTDYPAPEEGDTVLQPAVARADRLGCRRPNRHSRYAPAAYQLGL